MSGRALPPARGMFGNMLVLAGGTAASQLILVCMSPVLTRLYDPGHFGALGLFTTLVMILNTMNSLRYEMAIPVAKERDVPGLLLLIGILLTGYCLLLGGALARWGDAFCRQFRVPEMIPYLWLVIPSVAAAGVFEALNYLAVRDKRFGHIVNARVTLTSGQVGVQLVLGFFRIHTLGLLLSDTVSRILAAVMAFKQGAVLARLKGARFRDGCAAAAAYARFPKFLSWATLLNITATQLPFLVVPYYFGSALAGHYFLAYRMLVLPASFIGAALNQAFLSEVAGMAEAPEQLRRLVGKVYVLLVSAYLPVYVLVFTGSPRFFPLLFGAKWAAAGDFAAILAPMTFVWATASPISSLLIVKNRLHESLAFTVLELSCVIVAIQVGHRYGSLRTTVLLISGLGICNASLSVWRFLRAAGVELKALLPNLWPLLLLNLPLALFCWGAIRAFGPWLALGMALLGTGITLGGTVQFLKQRGLL